MHNCDKIKYKSKYAANAALYLQQKQGCAVKRSYYCHRCNAYHLTSEERVRKKRRVPYVRNRAVDPVLGMTVDEIREVMDDLGRGDEEIKHLLQRR